MKLLVLIWVAWLPLLALSDDVGAHGSAPTGLFRPRQKPDSNPLRLGLPAKGTIVFKSAQWNGVNGLWPYFVLAGSKKEYKIEGCEPGCFELSSLKGGEEVRLVPESIHSKGATLRASSLKVIRSGTDHGHPGLGNAWRDPSGVLWGDAIKTADPSSFDCSKFGGRMPTKEDFRRLAHYLSDADGKNYQPQILPHLDQFFLYRKGGFGDYGYFDASTGKLVPTPTRSDQLEDAPEVRCLVGSSSFDPETYRGKARAYEAQDAKDSVDAALPPGIRIKTASDISCTYSRAGNDYWEHIANCKLAESPEWGGRSCDVHVFNFSPYRTAFRVKEKTAELTIPAGTQLTVEKSALAKSSSEAAEIFLHDAEDNFYQMKCSVNINAPDRIESESPYVIERKAPSFQALNHWAFDVEKPAPEIRNRNFKPDWDERVYGLLPTETPDIWTNARGIAYTIGEDLLTPYPLNYDGTVDACRGDKAKSEDCQRVMNYYRSSGAIRALTEPEQLTKLLRSPDSDKVMFAARKLTGSHQDAARVAPALVDALTTPFQTDADSSKADARKEIIKALGSLGEAAGPFVEKALKNDNYMIRAGAAQILGSGKVLPPKQAVNLIGKAATEDKDSDVRYRAVWALGKLARNDSRKAKYLKEALQDRDPSVREEAQKLLGPAEEKAEPAKVAQAAAKPVVRNSPPPKPIERQPSGVQFQYSGITYWAPAPGATATYYFNGYQWVPITAQLVQQTQGVVFQSGAFTYWAPGPGLNATYYLSNGQWVPL